MGSIFYMERNGQKYAYESTSVRVPGRKNPKTIKTYLGKVDPETGKIIPKKTRSVPKEEYAKFYGSIRFLDGVQRELGILKDLESVFTTLAPSIMGAAMALTINPTSFDALHYIVEGSVIKETMKLRGTSSPSSIGELSEKVGSMVVTMDNFFTKRIERTSGDFLFSDLTSISSHSNVAGWTQLDHNRDGEDLKQTDIAMVTDGKGVPVMFRMLPGSIADIGIMESTIEDMKNMGCHGRMVMGRGSESAKNVSALLDLDVDFTIPSNMRSEPIKKLMTKAIKGLNLSSSFAYHNGAAYKYAEYDVGIMDLDDGTSEYIVHVPQNHKGSAKNNGLFSKSRKLKAFVVYDPRKAASDIDTVMSMVNDVESRLGNTRHDDPAMAYAKLPPSVRRFLDYDVDDNGIMHIIRKQNAFTFADNRAGMFVMLSSTNTTWEQMMASYDVRDSVEKAFDVYRKDPDGKLDGTGNVERARGRFFIRFIALMMRAHIRNVLREHDRDTLSTGSRKDSVNGMTVDELLLSLNTVFAIGNTGNWRLTAISKDVREIFTTFGLKPPQSGQIVLE